MMRHTVSRWQLLGGCGQGRPGCADGGGHGGLGGSRRKAAGRGGPAAEAAEGLAVHLRHPGASPRPK